MKLIQVKIDDNAILRIAKSRGYHAMTRTDLEEDLSVVDSSGFWTDIPGGESNLDKCINDDVLLQLVDNRCLCLMCEATSGALIDLATRSHVV